ncbi:cupin domain-containing protein [Streptomyces pseudovenezuelae]|uniref:Mannose-6-phosphate isomerase-like protein (Cupin superfamily) n=1 Tax=Streptomyces pseudovenezuelae TaxID=67350 RepID=A0ABT6LKQ7_9ACTN|nr:cupin domain-containing protein [Streptomyces pseudovenezuelae]MDH6216890.1 mannose-6-phosphate isomerase-like protein (cupin superfamily) [Streptomyces pseudovenezuelae]
MQIVKRHTLPTVQINGEVAAYIFNASKYPDATVSAFIVDVAAAAGPPRHLHPYEEIFIIVEGTVRLESDGKEIDATPDDICVVPAGVPHKFTNLGPGRARMVNIHAAQDVVTEFVPDEAANSSYAYNRPVDQH